MNDSHVFYNGKVLGMTDDGLMAYLTRTVNGTGHTGPSEFCATSI